MTGWTQVQRSASQSTAGNPTLPANTTKGNLVIIIATQGSATALTPPAGFSTVISIANGSVSETFIMASFNTAGGQSSWTVTGGSGGAIQAEAIEFTCPFVGLVTGASATGTQTGGKVSTITITGGAGTLATDLVVVGACEHSGSAFVPSWVTPSGYTDATGSFDLTSTTNHGYGASNPSASAGGAQSVAVNSGVSSSSSTGWTGALASFSLPPAPVVAAPPGQPLLSPAQRPQIIPTLASTGATNIVLTDTGAGADAVGVTVTSNIPLLVQNLPTLLPPYRSQQPQVITGPLIAPALTDSGVGTDSLSVAITNMPMVVPVPPSLPFTSPAGPPQVIAPVSPQSIGLTDSGTGADSLQVTVASNIPVVILPPLLIPLSSPAAPPQVIAGPVSATQAIGLSDSGVGTDSLSVVITSNMPVVLTGLPTLPALLPSGKPQVIAPVSPYVIGLADSGAGADSLSVVITNIPMVVPGPASAPLLSPAGPPQVIILVTPAVPPPPLPGCAAVSNAQVAGAAIAQVTGTAVIAQVALSGAAVSQIPAVASVSNAPAGAARVGNQACPRT